MTCPSQVGLCFCGKERGHDGRHKCRICPTTWWIKAKSTQREGQT